MVTGIDDVLAGQVGYGVDAVGRVTSVTRNADRVAGAGVRGRSVTESYGWSTAGVLTRVDPGADFRDVDPAGPDGSGVAGARPGAGEAGLAGAAESSAVGVELDGTLVTRSGRTRYFYDGAGRVVRTVTTRLSLKPLVREFGYGAGTQVRSFTSSDDPGFRWVYSYDGLARRVAKSKVDVVTGEVVHRVVFVHDGDRLVAEQTVIDEFGGSAGADNGLYDSSTRRVAWGGCVESGFGHPGPSGSTGPTGPSGHRAGGAGGGAGAGDALPGRVWVSDPGSGEVLGQVELSGACHGAAGSVGAGADRGAVASVAEAGQAAVDAVFFALVADLAGAPRELLDPDTGTVAGRATQSLYGRRTWRGAVSSPLLFAGQYADTESGWVYNRFRFYDPTAGVYGAQDPLGVGPKLATAQGYVDHAGAWVDPLGLAGSAAHRSKSSIARQRDANLLNTANKSHSVVSGEIPKGHRLNPHEYQLSISREPETSQAFLKNRAAGGPDVVQYHGGKLGALNRREATRGWNKTNGSPDEFPWACTVQGGNQATVVGVSLQAQRKQGGIIGSFIKSENVKIGDWIRISPVD